MNSNAELEATYYGFIGSTLDALILFEACIAGQVKQVSRRPRDRERERVIKSGKVLIYEENTSGIKRWSDGISWSPSRILGNFLVYRQLAKAVGPAKKKKVIKKSKVGPTGISKNNQSNNGRHKDSHFQEIDNFSASGGSYKGAGTINAETERALIGSLTNSYDFLEGGLVKKTISVTCEDLTHHLVSYYTIADSISRKFLEPSKDPRFTHTQPRPSLLTVQNFRSPIGDINSRNRSAYELTSYEMANQSIIYNHLPTLAAPEAYSNNGMYSGNYAMPITFPAYTSIVGYTSQYAPTPSICLAPQRPEQYNTDYRQPCVVSNNPYSDDSRAQISTISNLQQRSAIFQSRGREDSGVLTPVGNFASDSTYNQGQNSYYGFPRDITLPPSTIATQKAQPSLPHPDFLCQTAYERPALNGPSYCLAISIDSREMLQMGNVTSGTANTSMFVDEVLLPSIPKVPNHAYGIPARRTGLGA